MPIPAGTAPILGPLVDTSGSLLSASTALRDANAVSLRGAKLQRVNSNGNGWEEVPGHVVDTTEPTDGLFAGLLWYDTTNDLLKAYDGSDFTTLGGGFTLRTGSGQPATSLGASGDWYLRTSNGQWYEKVNTTWHGRYTPHALSNVAPLATSTSADEGTGVAGSREDHIHVGLVLGNASPEDTANAADTGTAGFASREDHAHAVGFGGGNVESVGSANSAGVNPHPSRRDHVHDGGTSGGGA